MLASTTTELPLPGTEQNPPPARVSAVGAETFATGFAALVCLLTQLPQHVLDAAGARAWGLSLVVVVAVVSGARSLARAPFTLLRTWSGTVHPDRAVTGWARTEVTTFLASTAGAAAVTIPVYALLRATPAWWLPAWLLFAALTVGWQLVLPRVLRAQAGHVTPASGELAERLQIIAVAAGVDAADVVVSAKTGKRSCNAYVVGIGRSRRIVLERAVADWPPDLVEQVVAHELGHWRLGHTARRLPLTLLAQLVTLAAAAAALSYAPLLELAGVSSAGDPASYPLLLLVGAVVALPARLVLAWRDRAQERAADRFALALLDRPDEFAAMLRRAADESGVPRRLPWWKRLTASHPPVDERTAAARCDLCPTGA